MSKQGLIGVAIWLATSIGLPATAQEVPQAIVPDATQGVPGEEELGRLFYTAKERASLNANIVRIVKEPPKPVPIPPSITLNGVVTRSDGQRTVWVDGQPYYRGDPKDMRVITHPDAPGGAELKVPGVRQQRPVRVGQQLDPASGETFESYELAPSLRRAQAPARASGSESASEASTE